MNGIDRLCKRHSGRMCMIALSIVVPFGQALCSGRSIRDGAKIIRVKKILIDSCDFGVEDCR